MVTGVTGVAGWSRKASCDRLVEYRGRIMNEMNGKHANNQAEDPGP